MGKTRGVHETTPELRNRMVGMYEAGLGLRDIAAAVNCSQRTVKRWLNRFDKEGTVETRERCGRKRATTEEEDDAIIRLATQTPITAAKAVLPALGLTCSVDTIRERLHKAGIHNWSPSRKHMQRIPLGDGDGSTIQQAVWRPTGTQLGKKKLASKEGNGRNKKPGSSSARRKTRSLKLRAREVYAGDGAPGVNKEPAIPPEFVYSEQNVPQVSQANNEIQVPSESLPNDQTQFVNSLNVVQSSTSQVYEHHPGLNVVQNWPLDLVQGSHHYPQGQPHSLSHEEAPAQQHLQELHTQQEQEHQAQQRANRQQLHEQIQSHHHHNHHNNDIHSLEQEQGQNHPQQHSMEIDQVQQHREISVQSKTAPMNDRPCKVTRSDSCSNSSSSNDLLSETEDLSKDSTKDEDEKSRSLNKGRNKGGKAKGTLETSVEIRNRMIGMSDAGLSTLSIALAINRSERTVKRWLERWNKEGNVQTKERKGRRRITTKEQDDAIIAMATQHPLTAAKHVAPALGLNCSVDTIRERLHKAGIHSWKLGKKPGEGNAVHTVHLWQPSGNRPNKPKIVSDKRVKLSIGKKRAASSVTTIKRAQRKKVQTEKIAETCEKVNAQSASIINEAEPMQFHETVPLTNYVQGPEMMQSVHNLPPPALVSSPPGPQISAPVSQTMQSMGSIMQQRSDCRMTSGIVPSTQVPAYSSCMVNNENGHVSHMEPPDSMNYEPYIWSF